jgi:putative (di)nucleoside polyphosphate hydrolase
MIDEYGYRPNVGIVLCNEGGNVFWARRCGQNGWQFPQGGIGREETLDEAMYRELQEEVGLTQEHVEILGRTREWLHYDIPQRYRRRPKKANFKGQKQIWFLLRLIAPDRHVCLTACDKPEFDDWRWIHYWSPIEQIIDFKREVYRLALSELAIFLPVMAPHHSRA